MPSALESRAALTLVTGAAVSAATRLLGALTGSPEQIRGGLLDGVFPIIEYFADGSSALAADFYDDERERAAVRGRFLAEPVVADRGRKIGNAIAWAAQPLFGGDGDTAGRLAGVVQLETARPFRDTITANQERDPQADGWARVTAGGGCKLCQRLAARGAVYREKSARFATHTHCHCTARPTFRGVNPPPEADLMQYLASKRRKSEADRARIREWLGD